MAEQLKVSAQGELVVLVAEGEAGTCEVRLTLEEATRFRNALDRAEWRATRGRETRLSREATRIHGVDDDDGDPGQGVAE